MLGLKPGHLALTKPEGRATKGLREQFKKADFVREETSRSTLTQMTVGQLSDFMSSCPLLA